MRSSWPAMAACATRSAPGSRPNANSPAIGNISSTKRSSAALLDRDGSLLGIGSLFVQQVDENETQTDGNMIVPIELLDPILDDLLKFGRSQHPQHPWLGAYTAESNGQLLVAGLAEDGPAESADIQVGDIILAVAGESVSDLSSMLRKTWSLGSAGVEVPLTLLRNDEISNVSVTSSDRMLYMKTPKLH